MKNLICCINITCTVQSSAFRSICTKGGQGVCVPACLCVRVIRACLLTFMTTCQIHKLPDEQKRHNVLIQLDFIQPYSKFLHWWQQYSRVYFGTALKWLCFHICPSSWVTSLTEQQFFVWSCHRKWVMVFEQNTLLLYTWEHTLTHDCVRDVCTDAILCYALHPNLFQFYQWRL